MEYAEDKDNEEGGSNHNRKYATLVEANTQAVAR